MTYSKTGNKKVRRQSLRRVKTPEWAILKRLPPHFFIVGRLTASFSLGAMTGVRTVSQNKSVISWASEPPHYTFCFQRFGFPGIHPGCQRKGCRSFLDKIGAVFPCFLCFWKPFRLTTKPFVLLNTLPHILHEVCGLAVQHITNLLQRIHGQMLHGADTDGRYRGRSDARPFCQFLLGHATHGKHHFDLELYHLFSLLPSGDCITDFVVNQYAMRKNISPFVVNNYAKRIDKLRFS